VDGPQFSLEVVTLKRVIFSGMVEGLTAPGTVGYFGILKGHTPFVSSLQPGVFTLATPGGETKRMAISGGFFSTDGEKAIVLADSAEGPGEIDVERARSSQDRAQRRLSENLPDLDVSRAKSSLARALTRLKVAGVS
jgi:F-type H+-transporting ATPase subunit epsilon